MVKSNDEVFAACDYLTIHVPYNKDTEGMICAEAIAKMKDGVRILNYARGELVNDDDMIAALESGKVSCYCTDFPNAKTAHAKGIIATPHLGASTPESENVPAMIAAVTTAAASCGLNIENMVNASRGDFAYTMLDLKGEVSDTMMDTLGKIEGIIRVRVIR